MNEAGQRVTFVDPATGLSVVRYLLAGGATLLPLLWLAAWLEVTAAYPLAAAIGVTVSVGLPVGVLLAAWPGARLGVSLTDGELVEHRLLMPSRRCRLVDVTTVGDHDDGILVETGTSRMLLRRGLCCFGALEARVRSVASGVVATCPGPAVPELPEHSEPVAVRLWYPGWRSRTVMAPFIAGLSGASAGFAGQGYDRSAGWCGLMVAGLIVAAAGAVLFALSRSAWLEVSATAVRLRPWFSGRPCPTDRRVCEIRDDGDRIVIQMPAVRLTCYRRPGAELWG